MSSLKEYSTFLYSSDSPPGPILPCKVHLVVMVQPFLVVITDMRCYWHLVGRDQGCYYTSANNYPEQNVNSAKIEETLLYIAK